MGGGGNGIIIVRFIIIFMVCFGKGRERWGDRGRDKIERGG